MSNDIYNILKNFNKVAQDTPKPAEKKVKPKSKLQEQFEQFKEKSTLNESTVSEVAPPAMRQAGRAAGQVLGAGIGAALTGLPAALIGGLALGPGGAIGAGAAAGLPGAKAGVDVGGYEGQRAANVAHDKIVNLWRRASAALGGPEATAEFIRAHASAAKQGLDKFNFNDEVYAVTMNPMQANKAMQELSSLQESVGGLLSEKYMGFKKTVAAVKKGGSAENPEAVAAAIGRKKYGKEKFQQAAAAGKKLGEAQQDESALQAYLGKKKYGEQGMKALQKAGKDGASKETMAKIRAKHDKMDESEGDTKHDAFKNVDPRVNKPTIKGTDKKAKTGYFPNTKQVKKLEKPIDEGNDGNLANNAKPYDKVTRGDVIAGRLGKDEMGGKKKKVKEVAPPGAKAERMVKHIKQGYAKDGKVTPKEKSIAYATAWKAHSKGKVEEAIRSMLAAGYSKEQIVEGWADMLKDVERRSQMRTGDKVQGHKGEIEKTSTGVRHTRRYNAKTGETDDAGNLTKEKRGRGRPKKSAFEGKYTAVSKMITESFLSETDYRQADAPIRPKDAQEFMKSSDPKIFDKLTGNKTQFPAGGTIKQGVWTATPPAKGDIPVPVPTDPEGVPKSKMTKEDEDLAEMLKLAGLEEADMEEGNEFSGALAKAKASGAKEFEVDGKSYPVKEDTQIDECGMSPMGNGMMGQEQQDGKMNINTSMDSDGHKSVTITADGNAALELMQMLKLAGMGSGQTQAEPEGVMVVSTDDEEMEENLVPQPVQPKPTKADELRGNSVDEAKDERYHASTTPDEKVEPVQAQTKGGNGDVAGQEKKMRKHGYQFGDNNLAMKEVAEGIDGLEAMGRKLYKEYESIKVQK